jgi:hypothetical protein
VGRGGTKRAATAGGIIHALAIKRRERLAKTAEVIAEVRVVDRIPVSLVAVSVEGIVAFEQHMVGAHHVTGINADLDPAVLAVDVAVVHIIIGDD